MFSIPAHNANVERVFSLMTAQWTKERNKLDITTVEALLLCKWNMDKQCKDFYKEILLRKDLLKKAKSSDKYN